MQKDLDEAYPDLDITIIGINEIRNESGNSSITSGRELAWLQDVDADNNNVSDVWYDSWDIEYRDVVVLNAQNEVVYVVNLTADGGVGNPVIYDELRQSLIDTAEQAQQPAFQAGDSNRDFKFDQHDIVMVATARKYGTGQSATWEEGDWNNDGVFDQLDVLAALQTGNYLQGPYAARTIEDAAVIPMFHEDAMDTSEDDEDDTRLVDAHFAEFVPI